jgi:hypothetical protein
LIASDNYFRCFYLRTTAFPIAATASIAKLASGEGRPSTMSVVAGPWEGGNFSSMARLSV